MTTLSKAASKRGKKATSIGHTACPRSLRNTTLMHRSTAGYNPYNLFSLTIDYSKNFTTNKLLTIGHMPMFVVKSIVS